MSARSVADDVTAALDNDAHAAARFDSLPLSHQKEYLTWIDEAKKPATRAKRIAGMIGRLSSGPVE